MAYLAQVRHGARNAGHHSNLFSIYTPANWIQHNPAVAPLHLQANRAHAVASYQFSHRAVDDYYSSDDQQEGVFRPRRRDQRFRGEGQREYHAPPFNYREFIRHFFSRKYNRTRAFFNRAVYGASVVGCMVVLSDANDPVSAAAMAAAGMASHHEPPRVDNEPKSAVPPPSHQQADPHHPPSAADFLNFLFPELNGPLQPVAPIVNFGIAGLAGYISGSFARAITRMGFFLVGGGALVLYGLQKQGVVEIKQSAIQDAARQLAREQKKVEDALKNSESAFWKTFNWIIEGLTSTSQGIGFSAGFLLAFK